jgi:hypothetical protein
MRFYKIAAVAAPRYPVLRLTFDDGFAGEVDFSGTIAEGGVMTALRDPDFFAKVQIGERGRSIGWLTEDGDELDFCADALRFQAEEQVVRKRAARYAARKNAAAE